MAYNNNRQQRQDVFISVAGSVVAELTLNEAYDVDNTISKYK